MSTRNADAGDQPTTSTQAQTSGIVVVPRSVTEDEVRALAYTLWQANPDSEAGANWLEAERILWKRARE